MVKLSMKTKLDAGEVIERAVAFFGPSGHGLETEARDPASVTFKGGGGGVIVEVGPARQGTRTVDLTSREWDFQTQQFLDKLR